jgi:hypothetical protein
MEYNRRVIAVSLDCIKSLIVKLDRDGDLGCDGVEYVMSQFSPSEAADSPLGMLDSLILYLFHIHRVDWYSRTWHVGLASSLTVREERGIVVTAADEEELVEEKILELKERTKMFLKVLLKHTLLSLNILRTVSQLKQARSLRIHPLLLGAAL